MSDSYKNTSPNHIGGRKPGDMVDVSVVPDWKHLVRIGWLERVKSGAASSTMMDAKKLSQEKQ